MKTSWKPFLQHSERMGSRVREGERGSVEDDGRSGCPKDATADDNVMVVHTLVLCDRRRDLRSIASEVGVSLGQYTKSLQHLRYVKGFRRMAAANVER